MSSVYIEHYKQMLRIRMVEEAIADNYNNSIREMHTPIHLSDGQEAVAVGVSANLYNEDRIFSNHRSHAHYLAKGGNLNRMIAELYNKEEGCCHGRGGSMHLMDRKAGVELSSSIVAGNVPIATGYALSQSLRNENNVTVVFFGDGASEEGTVYESICFAQIKKLPIIFVCENNLYAISTGLDVREPQTNISDKFIGIIETSIVDGNDILEVLDKARYAINKARNGEGPIFLECKTYRFRDHHNVGKGIESGYRTMKEWDENNKKCPIKRFEQYLLNNSIINKKNIKQIECELALEIANAFTFAKESECPKTQDLMEGLWG